MKQKEEEQKGNRILQVKETNDLTTELQRLQKENDDIKEKIKNKDAIIGTLEADNKANENRVCEENNRLRQDNSNMRREIQQLGQESNNRTIEIHELRQENINKNQEIRQLQREIISTKNENQQLQQEKEVEEEFRSSFFVESGSVVISREELGRGSWGAVYTGDFYGTTVAVKEFHEIILSPHNEEILHREVVMASQCRHPNLLQFICATKNDQRHLLIVTERMDMTLRKLLEQHATEKSRLEYQEIKSISLDVACGLNYLHSKTPKPIIHRDISSANVLLFIKNGEVRRAKISDYGSANFMQACNTANPGAAIYAAPEARQAQQDPKVIIFQSDYKMKEDRKPLIIFYEFTLFSTLRRMENLNGSLQSINSDKRPAA